jgi:hypothetical protein
MRFVWHSVGGTCPYASDESTTPLLSRALLAKTYDTAIVALR